MTNKVWRNQVKSILNTHTKIALAIVSSLSLLIIGVMSGYLLSNEVLSDPNAIAASLTGASGDNQIALLMTDLRLAQVFDGQTLTETFADVIYGFGTDVKLSKNSAERSELLTTQANNFREAVKGVSMNEETANLLKFQQAYQAAARIISVADEMMRTIINLGR